MSNEFFCIKCNVSLNQNGQNSSSVDPCPICGLTRPNLVLTADDSFQFSDSDVDIHAQNSSGKLVAERVARARQGTEGHITTDLGEPSILKATRISVSDKFAEEGEAAAALAIAYNIKHGTHYFVLPKDKDDYEFEDRILASVVEQEHSIPVQITHLDPDVISSLGRDGKFDGSRDSCQLVSIVEKAIERKSQVDPVLKSSTILLLQLPTPIGIMLREELQRMSVNQQGFNSIWCYPLGEECFELFPYIPHAEIAVAAYYRWEKAGRLIGEDQRNWYEAIKELRKI